MLKRIVVSTCAALALAATATAGELTRGLTITGGQNASAKLVLERVNDPADGSGVLKIHVSLSNTKNLKGYGLSLQFDPAKYDFVKASEPDGNLLKSGSGRETLFLASDRTPGQLEIAAMKVDGQGISGQGELVELVFTTSGTPAATDFQISESVLVGLDGKLDVPARVEIGDLQALPERFALDQNVPNPFNPATVIGYQLPEAGWVRLTIYNLLGQEVRVLVDEEMQAGSFTATWDGTDEQGRRVGSGVYFYTINVGDFSASRRMLLLK